MTFDWQRITEPADVRVLRRYERSDLSRNGRKPGRMLAWFRLFILRRRADALLRRAVGPVPPTRYEDARALPERLLRDIGLQPPL